MPLPIHHHLALLMVLKREIHRVHLFSLPLSPVFLGLTVFYRPVLALLPPLQIADLLQPADLCAYLALIGTASHLRQLLLVSRVS